MNPLSSLITLLLVVSMTQSAYPQSAAPELQKQEVKSSIQTQVDVKTARSNELFVEQIGGAPSGGAVVVQKPQAETKRATSESQNVVVQRGQGGRIFPDSDEKSTAVPAPAPAHKIQKSRIAIAWERYNAGNISEAVTLFRTLLTLPGMNQDATFGLVMCYLALKDPAKALPLLENLVTKHFRIRETLPELLKILLDRKEFQKAAEYAALLDEKERATWQRRIDEGVLIQRYVRLKESGSMPEAVAFLNEYENVLKRCSMPDTFNNLAAFFVKNANTGAAVSIYRTLLSCTGNEDVQLGILYSLKPLLPHRELLMLAEQKKNKASSAYLKKLDTFMVELLYGILNAEPEQVEETAKAILKIRPTDQIALMTLGWWYFNKQRYEDAYASFRRLNNAASKKYEPVEGMIYALMKLERLDEALTIARLHKNYQKIAPMTDDVTMKILWNRVSSLPSDSSEFEDLAKKILLIRPDNEEIKVVRAWWYYKRNEFEKAYEEFNGLYTRNPGVKGYSYGLASTLAKLKRYDEAARIASTNKELDERLAAFETDIYLERARFAYEQKRYQEAGLYFGKVLDAEPDDEEVKTLLESSRYRQTLVSKVLSPIVGLSGNTSGSVFNDPQGATGTGVSLLVSQGIDWVKLPWDVLLRTYGELWYRTRSKDFTYYDIFGRSLGIELKKSIFRLGAEYVSEQYTTQSKSDAGPHLFLGWYQDWYKYMYDRSEDAGWFNIQSLSGSTYGKLSDDLGGSTGTGVSGSINQGIDWLTLPGNIKLNSFVEYRYSFRTRDNVYYNEHGPVVGTELQRSPFKAGIECYWEHDPERHLLNSRVTAYLKWYYGWDLKPDK